MLQNRPILIVEHDAAAAERLGSACRDCGYEAIIANDSAQAHAFAKRTPPRLILSDTAVPGMDGFEAARWVRNCADLKETKVVALTQNVPSNPAANQPEYDDYILKPLKLEDITNVIRKLM